MRKEVSTTELHQKLGELLDGVYRNGDRLIVKRADTPLAAIVPIEIYCKIEGFFQLHFLQLIGFSQEDIRSIVDHQLRWKLQL